MRPGDDHQLACVFHTATKSRETVQLFTFQPFCFSPAASGGMQTGQIVGKTAIRGEGPH